MIWYACLWLVRLAAWSYTVPGEPLWIELTSLALLSSGLLLYVRFVVRRWPQRDARDALRMGMVWLALSLVALASRDLWLSGFALYGMTSPVFRRAASWFFGRLNPLSGSFFLVPCAIVACGPYFFATRAPRRADATPSPWRPYATMAAASALHGALVADFVNGPSAKLVVYAMMIVSGPALLVQMLFDTRSFLVPELFNNLMLAALGYGFGLSPRPVWVRALLAFMLLASAGLFVFLLMGGGSPRFGP